MEPDSWHRLKKEEYVRFLIDKSQKGDESWDRLRHINVRTVVVR